MGPLPGPVRGSDSLKFLLSPVIYKGGPWQRLRHAGSRPGPSRRRRDAVWRPKTPGRASAGHGCQTRDQECALGGRRAPGGAALRPLPTPTRRPRDWKRKGEVRPRPRTAPSGLEAVLEGGGIRGGGNAIAFPHPKHGRRPPPAGGGGGFRIGGAKPGRPTEEALPMPDPGDPNPRPPGLAPEEVTHLHGPSPGAAPPPNLPPSPALGRRGFHAGRDSPLKATSNTRTLIGGGGGGQFKGALHSGFCCGGCAPPLAPPTGPAHPLRPHLGPLWPHPTLTWSQGGGRGRGC